MLLVSLVAAVSIGACTSFYEIPIETPIQPKLDVTPFQRVLVAGFVAGGTDEVDANMETVRLLRSQLRTKSQLRVIDTDIIPIAAVAAEQPRAAEGDENAAPANGPPDPKDIRDEKDLEAFDHVFANAAFWRKLGEEYQSPLIVTGTILFTPHARSGFVQREREVVDAYGRRSVQPVRTYMERKGFILRPKFVFIDGRTGTPLYSETFREEVLYNPQQDTPALSSYFELMDRLIPGFLGTLSSQKIKGTRVLLK
ncbi:MAG TPA: hypothetical protein VK911_01750 [Vicinamibacterales bacterium]|nr:hypothetical protein [Vicinamibacterales bacterium]